MTFFKKILNEIVTNIRKQMVRKITNRRNWKVGGGEVIYEGYWRADKANVHGRLIQADGDIYDLYLKGD